MVAGYHLNQSALYAVMSPKMLAVRLNIPLDDLEGLVCRSDNYLVWSAGKSTGSKRVIEQPKPQLQRLHGRIHLLLSRVVLPYYVHSVRKRRSYIANAHRHLGKTNVIKIDIEKFYTNVRSGAVASFFREEMRCAPDVSALLARLLTFDGHLPTGSKSSPILSYSVHKKMFDEIYDLSRLRGLAMSLYVDDIVISGPDAHRGMLRQVRDVIARHGLRSHKIRHFSGSRPKIITGVMVGQVDLCVPNRRHLRIRNGYSALHSATTDAERLDVLKSLCGLVHEAAQIEPRFRTSAYSLEHMRRNLRTTF